MLNTLSSQKSTTVMIFLHPKHSPSITFYEEILPNLQHIFAACFRRLTSTVKHECDVFNFRKLLHKIFNAWIIIPKIPFNSSRAREQSGRFCTNRKKIQRRKCEKEELVTFWRLMLSVLMTYLSASLVRVVASAAPTKKSPSIMYCLKGGL